MRPMTALSTLNLPEVFLNSYHYPAVILAEEVMF